MTTFANVIEFVNNYRNATFGLSIVSITEPKMNKFPNGTAPADRKHTPENPYIGRVKTLAVYTNAACGCNFYNLVKAECEREGIHFSDDEFSAAFPKQATYASSEDNKVYTNDSGKQYIRIYKGRRPTKVDYYTMIDGEIVANDSPILADARRYMQARKPSAKQTALGIANLIEPRNIGVENILGMKQGEKSYESASLSLVMAKIKAFVG